jgi:hypothetical protein
VSAVTRVQGFLDRLFAPQWAVGWAYARWLWVLAASLQYGTDFLSIPDVWGSDDMLFTSGAYYRLAEQFVVSPSMAYVWWGSIMVSIAMVAWGGRLTKVGLVCFIPTAWSWLAYEAVNLKAHDRLLLFVTLALLMSPISERNLGQKMRSPFARWAMMILFSAAYGATGVHKALLEPTWFTDGSVLANHLVHPFHGSKPIGVWLSGQSWLVLFSSVITVVWECAFPFLIWFKRLTPPMLLLGFLFHFILLLTMNVGPFAFVAYAAYPVLLHPDYMQSVHTWLVERVGGAPAQ